MNKFLESSYKSGAEGILVDDIAIDKMSSQELKKICAELLMKSKIYLKNNSELSQLLRVYSKKANEFEQKFLLEKNESEKAKIYYDKKLGTLNGFINDKIFEKNYEDEIRLLQVKLELSERKINEFENKLLKQNTDQSSDDATRSIFNEISNYNEESDYLKHQLQKVCFA